MTSESFVIGAGDGHTIAVHEWRAADPVGSVIWLHGMAEHGARYQALGETLAEHGWNLYCPDHRGHGASMDAADPPGHFADQDGWRRVMDDLGRVIDHLREREPGALVLGGHSMGSFLALAGAQAHGDKLDGLVLCGSDYHPPLYYRLMASVLKWQRRRHGARGHSALVHKLTFEAWARSVPDARTDFDWLSADPAQVKAYIDDPKCGFQCTTATWLALLSALADVQSSKGLSRLPARLPILLLGGRQDPMSGGGKGMDRLQQVLSRRRLPLERMDCPRGRHEILNDFCAPEVRQTLLEWLNRRI